MREALLYVMGTPESDCGTGAANGEVTVIVPSGCYRLGSGLEVVWNSLSPVSGLVISGAGVGAACSSGSGTVIDAQRTAPAITIANKTTVTISRLTVIGGLGRVMFAVCAGGGIINGGGLSLSAVMITGNAAGSGIDQTTPGSGTPGGVGGNGGGILNLASGGLTVTDSAIVGNTAGTGGAGADGLGNSGAPGGPGGQRRRRLQRRLRRADPLDDQREYRRRGWNRRTWRSLRERCWWAGGSWR